ncbi:hypothetical protein ANN_26952 [Periplaneta americana]|uniref:RNase H type-1 domain-containing protein n=1 Tax=Periplaneta americana TaxID=6978 RepID=A0ABQ8RWT4_PERAM|nr:hypothetical protein ANN_26952 [Periplaneta americana]
MRYSKASWGISYYHLLTMYNHAIFPVVSYAAEAWCQTICRRASIKLTQIQRSFLTFTMKSYKTVSNVAMQAIAGIMPIEQALHLNKDMKAVRRGLPTNAVLPKLKKTELPTRYGGIHPKDNSVTIGNSGTVIPANIQIFTDGSKTEKHVGAGMVAEENSMEIYTEARRLDNECSVFQAELLGIQMAVDWIQQQSKDKISYAIHVDSQAALFAIANKRTTQPIAVYIRKKIITLKKINKAPSPLCNCPEKSLQTARHLLTECSLYSRDRPRVLTTQTLPQILKFHINTVAVTNFISNIFRILQE